MNKIEKENTNTNKQKSVDILGDIILKHINGWEISKGLESDCKVNVKHFFQVHEQSARKIV